MGLGTITGGTVSVSNGSTAVTGSGTAFTESSVGSQFEALGLGVRIAAIASDTALTLAHAWPGTTLSGESAYNLTLEGSSAVALQNNQKVRDLLDALSLKGAILYGDGVPGSGLGTDDDTYFDETAGKIYRKSSGSWSVVWTGTITSEDVSDLVVLTQAAYDALSPPDANTLYAITEA